MPHFTIEYSANLDARVDMGKLVELVRKAAVETGVFPIGGIRVRAIRCEHYAIANGEANFGFLAMVLRLGEGRDLGGCGVGDDSADALGRCAQGVIEKVRVSACCLRLRMAKQTANYVQAHTRTGQLGGETVP